RALAGAVLPDERAHLASVNRQIDAIERNGRAESLPDAEHVEAWLGDYGFSHRERSGWRSSFMAGSFILSRVASCTPVSMRFSTGSPLMCATRVFTPRYPIFTGS